MAEVTAQTVGYRMREKLQVSNLPVEYTREQIVKLMSIFGRVLNVELIIDAHLKRYNVLLCCSS